MQRRQFLKAAAVAPLVAVLPPLINPAELGFHYRNALTNQFMYGRFEQKPPGVFPESFWKSIDEVRELYRLRPSWPDQFDINPPLEKETPDAEEPKA